MFPAGRRSGHLASAKGRRASSGGPGSPVAASPGGTPVPGASPAVGASPAPGGAPAPGSSLANRFLPDVLAPLCLCVGLALVYGAMWDGKSYFQQQSQTALIILSEVLSIAVFFAYAAFYRVFDRLFAAPKRTRTSALLAVGVTALAGRMLSSIPELTGSAALAPLPVAGVMLHTAGEAFLLVASHFMVSRFRPTVCAVVVPGAFVVAGFVMTLKQFVGVAAGNVFVAIGPIASAVLLMACADLTRPPADSPATERGEHGDRAERAECADRAERADRSERTEQEAAPQARLPLWPFVLMVAYDLVYHLITTIDTSTSSYGMVGLAAFSGIAVLVAVVRRASYSPLFLNKAALPFVVASLMCLTLSGTGQGVAALLSNTGSAAFYLFIIITFIIMCQRNECDAARSLSFLFAFEHVGHLLGDAAGMGFLAMFPEGGDSLQIAATAIAVVMVLIATVFLNDIEVARVFGLVPSSLRTDLGGAPTRGAVSVISGRENVSWQCAVAARTYGLTIREEETLEKLMLGLTPQQAADEMCVSLGTVKSHISHICHKLGVSSREEAVETALGL